MMALSRSWLVCVPLMAMAVGIGCRRNDPPPSHFEDLGDEETELLLPTAATWHDKDIAGGTAQWRPFREPRPAEEVTAEAEAAPEGDGNGVEAAVRELLADYSGVLTDGKFDELPDFFVTEQADGAKEVAETLSTFASRLREAAELTPREAENLNKLGSHLIPATALGLDIGRITVKGESEAVAVLATVPSLAFLPDMPAAADMPREARFTLGDDDYWYIESPFVPLLGRVAPFLKQSTGVLDSFIASARADGLTPENLQPVVDALKPVLDSMNAAGPNAEDSAAESEATEQPMAPEPDPAGAEAPDGT